MLISRFQPRSLGLETGTLHQCYRVQFRTRCNAWLEFVGSLLGSERIFFFLPVLHFASQAKNQPDLLRNLFYVIFSLVHQQSTCIRQDYVATQIDIDDACYNLTFVIIWSRRPHNCKTGHFTSQKERERLRNVKNENCTCKACKTIVFDNQICKFVTSLLPSSSWLRKLPNVCGQISEHIFAPNEGYCLFIITIFIIISSRIFST